mmetsp:Transcript_26516/g.74051  ORF Transcript_26516/g.74051 Transcript_26516/m.74051 type:complete len:100 (+) Transcript_26516:1505-1804(+)
MISAPALKSRSTRLVRRILLAHAFHNQTSYEKLILYIFVKFWLTVPALRLSLRLRRLPRRHRLRRRRRMPRVRRGLTTTVEKLLDKFTTVPNDPEKQVI